MNFLSAGSDGVYSFFQAYVQELRDVLLSLRPSDKVCLVKAFLVESIGLVGHVSANESVSARVL
jgi:hypothetical protein